MCIVAKIYATRNTGQDVRTSYMWVIAKNAQDQARTSSKTQQYKTNPKSSLHVGSHQKHYPGISYTSLNSLKAATLVAIDRSKRCIDLMSVPL